MSDLLRLLPDCLVDQLLPSVPNSRYAPGAVLLPTVSNKVRTTNAEIVDYFTNFLQLKPKGKIDESNVRLLTPDTAINSGVYTFNLTKEGQPASVQARYSFTYKKVGDVTVVYL